MDNYLDRFLARWFRTMDTDDDGYIERGDFILPPARLGSEFGHGRESMERKRLIDLALYCWQHMVQVSDLHPDVRLSEEGFKTAFSAALLEMPGAFDVVYVPLLSAMMDTIDGDRDGRITVTDKIQYAYALLRMPESSAREIFQRLDRDGDGFVATSDLLDTIRAAYFDHSADSPGQWLLGPLDQPLELLSSNNNNNNNKPGPCIPRIEFHRRRWWGFELHCNDCAVEFMEHFRDKLIRTIGRFLPMKVRGAIHAWLRVRSHWVNFLSTFGEGIRYLSPWPIPILLTPLPMRRIDWGSPGQPPPPDLPPPPPDQDTLMRWTLGDFRRQPSDVWSEAAMFPSHVTHASPALIEFRDKLYCLYSGPSLTVHFTCYDPEQGWSDGRWTGTYNFFSLAGPGATLFQDRLYCFTRGQSLENMLRRRLLYSIFDGSTWSHRALYVPRDENVEVMADLDTSVPVATVFRGELYVFFRATRRQSQGTTASSEIWYKRLNRNHQWLPAEQVSTIRASTGIAVAVQRDRLVCVYGQEHSGDLMLISFDGQRWSTPQRVNNLRTTHDPAIVSMENQVYGVVREPSSRLRAWCTVDPQPGMSWPATRDLGFLPGEHQSTHGVGLAVYIDKNMTDPNAEDFDTANRPQPQLMVVYRPQRV